MGGPPFLGYGPHRPKKGPGGKVLGIHNGSPEKMVVIKTSIYMKLFVDNLSFLLMFCPVTLPSEIHCGTKAIPPEQRQETGS
jgi:hypothetical protein